MVFALCASGSFVLLGDREVWIPVPTFHGLRRLFKFLCILVGGNQGGSFRSGPSRWQPPPILSFPSFRSDSKPSSSFFRKKRSRYYFEKMFYFDRIRLLEPSLQATRLYRWTFRSSTANFPGSARFAGLQANRSEPSSQYTNRSVCRWASLCCRALRQE